MNRETKQQDEATQAKLNRFLCSQRRWMNIGYTSSAIGICLMYVLLRSYFSSWPTVLTLLADSSLVQLGMLFAAGWGIALHMHADTVVRRKWAELGRLTVTLELPPPDVSILHRYLWIPVVVGLNELSGLVIYLVRR